MYYNKFKQHFQNGTLFDSLINFLLRIFGLIILKNKIRELLNKKHQLFDIPKAKPGFEFPRINGPTLVYGSAPSALIPNGYTSEWNILTANSSQYLTDKLGLKIPDLSLVCTTTFFHPNNLHDINYNIGALLALKGKQTSKLIMLEDEICGERTREKRNKKIKESVDLNQFVYKDIFFLPYAYRFKFVADVLKDKYFYTDALSTGFFTAIFAYYIGGSPIIMSGFSFKNQKHGYPDDFFNAEGGRGDKGRGELTGDLRAVEIILKNKWPFYAAEKQFSVESGLPYWEPKL